MGKMVLDLAVVVFVVGVVQIGAFTLHYVEGI